MTDPKKELIKASKLLLASAKPYDEAASIIAKLIADLTPQPEYIKGEWVEGSDAGITWKLAKYLRVDIGPYPFVCCWTDNKAETTFKQIRLPENQTKIEIRHREGEPMPEWIRGKEVTVLFYDGSVRRDDNPEGWCWNLQTAAIEDTVKAFMVHEDE